MKNEKIFNTYLFHGSEAYLIKQAEKELTERLVPFEARQMNLNVFEEKGFAAEDLVYAAESLPFFSEYRLIVVKDSGFFGGARKTDGDALAAYLPDLPETSVILFIEPAVDKRCRLYKRINEKGAAKEFAPLPEKELVQWTVGLFKEKGAVISAGCAAHLLRTVSHGMDAVCSEAEKLAAYCKGKPVTADDINNVCVKSVESRIFELTAAIAQKRADTALQLYHNMIVLKESPLMVLAMIARQFRLILQCAALSNEGKNHAETAQALGLRPFAVREYMSQSRNFNAAKLTKALRDCLDTDVNIKTGRMADVMAVEMLIVRQCLGGV